MTNTSMAHKRQDPPTVPTCDASIPRHKCIEIPVTSYSCVVAIRERFDNVQIRVAIPFELRVAILLGDSNRSCSNHSWSTVCKHPLESCPPPCHPWPRSISQRQRLADLT